MYCRPGSKHRTVRRLQTRSAAPKRDDSLPAARYGVQQTPRPRTPPSPSAMPALTPLSPWRTSTRPRRVSPPTHWKRQACQAQSGHRSVLQTARTHGLVWAGCNPRKSGYRENCSRLACHLFRRRSMSTHPNPPEAATPPRLPARRSARHTHQTYPRATFQRLLMRSHCNNTSANSAKPRCTASIRPGPWPDSMALRPCVMPRK